MKKILSKICFVILIFSVLLQSGCSFEDKESINDENGTSSAAEAEDKEFLNKELLECIGKPKSEIEEKYGKISASYYYIGGKYYMHGSLKTAMYYDTDEYNYDIDDDLASYSVCIALEANLAELFMDSSKEYYTMEELVEVFGEYEFIDDLANEEMGPSCFYKFTYGDYVLTVESDHKNPTAKGIAVYSKKSAGTKSIGGIELHEDAADVIDLLGEPESKGEAKFQDATGETVQKWNYPSKGIELEMLLTEYGQSVNGILVQSPCTLKMPSGIGIGSSVSDLHRVYKDGIDPEENFIDHATVVGTIYDGIIFYHDLENKKVVSIIIGAIAE